MHVNIYIYIRGDLLQELIHAVIEVRKSRSLLFASWKTRKANGIIYSEAEGLRTGGRGSLEGLGPTGISPGIQRPELQELRCLSNCLFR